jgi:hypothetical protein
LFHPANTAKELLGCVALGKRHGLLYNEPAVLSSNDAFIDFVRTMYPYDEFEMEVVNT